jgi:DNA polymerase IV
MYPVKAHARTRLPGLRKPPALQRQTTSEHDAGLDQSQMPTYLLTTYSCQRPTRANPPNAAFIEELKKIRKIRILVGDKIGIRAYSSSIAAIAAYPSLLTTPHGEVVPY